MDSRAMLDEIIDLIMDQDLFYMDQDKWMNNIILLGTKIKQQLAAEPVHTCKTCKFQKEGHLCYYCCLKDNHDDLWQPNDKEIAS